MSSRARRSDAPAAGRPAGLTADELRAEQAGDLPEREAMSILDVGGLPAGLPTPGDVDGVLDGGDPLDGQPALGVVDPIDGGGQTPIGGLPVRLPPIDTQPNDTQSIDTQPIDTQPIDGLPIDRLPGDGLIGIPEQPAIPDDESTIA
jgi:hypothetical protein